MEATVFSVTLHSELSPSPPPPPNQCESSNLIGEWIGTFTEYARHEDGSVEIHEDIHMRLRVDDQEGCSFSALVSISDNDYGEALLGVIHTDDRKFTVVDTGDESDGETLMVSGEIIDSDVLLWTAGKVLTTRTTSDEISTEAIVSSGILNRASDSD